MTAVPSFFLLLAAGIAMLVSLPILAAGGNLVIWVTAKAFYAVGVLLFLLDK
jgi:hypothetical protein